MSEDGISFKNKLLRVLGIGAVTISGTASNNPNTPQEALKKPEQTQVQENTLPPKPELVVKPWQEPGANLEISEALSELQERQVLQPENITESPELLGNSVRFFPRGPIGEIYTYPSLENGILRNKEQFPDLTTEQPVAGPGGRKSIEVTMPKGKHAIYLSTQDSGASGKGPVEQAWIIFPVGENGTTNWKNSKGEEMDVKGPIAFPLNGVQFTSNVPTS